MEVVHGIVESFFRALASTQGMSSDDLYFFMPIIVNKAFDFFWADMGFFYGPSPYLQ